MCFPEHHFSHAASAFYASPYPRAAVLTFELPAAPRIGLMKDQSPATQLVPI